MSIDQQTLHPVRNRTAEIAEDIQAIFNGSYAWVARILFVLGLILLGLLIWAIVRFSGAEDLRELVHWGVILIVLVQCILFIEVWFWMELHTQRKLPLLHKKWQIANN